MVLSMLCCKLLTLRPFTDMTFAVKKILQTKKLFPDRNFRGLAAEILERKNIDLRELFIFRPENIIRKSANLQMDVLA
jgi:hypothetical protein